MSNLDDIFSLNNEDNKPDNHIEPPKKPKLFRGATIIVTVLVIVALIGVFMIGMFVGQASYDGFSKDHALADEVYELVKKYYYEDVTRDEFDVLFAAGLTNGLDKYTRIVPVNISGTSEFGFTMSVDTYSVKTIKSIKEGSPLYGELSRGDIIKAVKVSESDEWLDVLHMTDTAFATFARKNETLYIKVERDGTDIEAGPFTKLPYVNEKLATYLATDVEGVGYVALDEFTEGAADDFMDVLIDFTNAKNNIMILDLRDNPGGSSIELARIVRNFIPKPTDKDLVIDINTNKGSHIGEKTYAERYTYDRMSDDHLVSQSYANSYIGDKVKEKTGKDFKMVILANGDTASAAEAFIGNILHYMDKDDYMLLGETDYTFGKGIAQGTFPLKSNKNYVINITIGKYYVLGPKGEPEEHNLTNIHEIGYKLDNEGIKAELKGDITKESAVAVGIEKALAKWRAN